MPNSHRITDCRVLLLGGLGWALGRAEHVHVLLRRSVISCRYLATMV